jgi:hypothetical protein
LTSVERNDPLIDYLLCSVRDGLEAAIERYIRELGPHAITYETLRNGRVRGILRPLDADTPRYVVADTHDQAADAVTTMVTEMVKARQLGVSVSAWCRLARSIDQDAQDEWAAAYARFDVADRADAGLLEFRPREEHHAPQA